MDERSAVACISMCSGRASMAAAARLGACSSPRTVASTSSSVPGGRAAKQSGSRLTVRPDRRQRKRLMRVPSGVRRS